MDTFYFDGGCGFCRRWTEYFKAFAGDGVAFKAFEDASDKTSSEFHFEDGTIARGALGIFTLVSAKKPGWLWAYRRVPLFGVVSEIVYRAVAKCRVCSAKLSRLFFGR